MLAGTPEEYDLKRFLADFRKRNPLKDSLELIMLLNF